MEPKEKVRMEAYLDAKHNMPTDGITTAIEQTQRKVDTAADNLAYHQAVLAGYKQAAKERGTKGK